MNEHPLHSLIALVETDRQIHHLQKLLETSLQQIEAIKAQESEYIHQLKKDRLILFDLKKEVDEQELEMAHLDQQEKEKKQQLEATAHYKELHVLQQEINVLAHRQMDAEQQLMTLWNRYELAKRLFEKKEKDLQVVSEQVQAEVMTKAQEAQFLQQEIEKQEKGRTAHLEKVPEEWREKYAAMRARVTDPVVEVLDGSCSACFYVIPESDLNRLRRGALIQCKQCFRFLFSSSMMT